MIDSLKRRLMTDCDDCNRLWNAYRTIILANVDLGKALFADPCSRPFLRDRRAAAEEAKKQAHNALERHIVIHDQQRAARQR